MVILWPFVTTDYFNQSHLMKIFLYNANIFMILLRRTNTSMGEANIRLKNQSDWHSAYHFPSCR